MPLYNLLDKPLPNFLYRKGINIPGAVIQRGIPLYVLFSVPRTIWERDAVVQFLDTLSLVLEMRYNFP